MEATNGMKLNERLAKHFREVAEKKEFSREKRKET
jgi:hypothetical protein